MSLLLSAQALCGWNVGSVGRRATSASAVSMMADEPPHSTVVFLRHGQSTWNEASLFTGWADVELTTLGKNEAAGAATALWRAGIVFDVAFSSRLKRAMQTLDIVLQITDQEDVVVHRTSRLNERMYGALTGLNKQETTAKYGEAQVKEWRRSYSVRPPDVDLDSQYYPGNDNKYCHIPLEYLPRAECLKDTVERALPYWTGSITPAIKRGKTILVAAHGNSIRGLLKYIDGIPEDEITSLEIPTGVPLVYHFDSELKPIKSDLATEGLSGYFLADPDDLKAKQERVAAEATATETWACIGSGCLILADDDLKEAFAKVDTNGDGFISHNELAEAVVVLGAEEVNGAAVEAMFNEIDANHDGQIDFEEFVQAMTTTQA